MKRLTFVLALVAAVAASAPAYEFLRPRQEYATGVAEYDDGTIAVAGRSYLGRPRLAGVAPGQGLLWHLPVSDVPGGIAIASFLGDMLVLDGPSVRLYSSAGDLILQRALEHAAWSVAVAPDQHVYFTGPDFIARYDARGRLCWTKDIDCNWTMQPLSMPDGGASIVTGSFDTIRRLNSDGEELWSTTIQLSDSTSIFAEDLCLSDSGIIGVAGAYLRESDYYDLGAFIVGLDAQTGEEMWILDKPGVGEADIGYEFRAIASIGSEFLAVGNAEVWYPSSSDAFTMRASTSGELLEETFTNGGEDRHYQLYDVCATSSGRYIAVGAAYSGSWNEIDCLIMNIPGPGQDSGGEMLARR
jgi:outer membrane protein assembly factor BamB